MTAKELIDRLQQIEDRTKEVKDGEYGSPIEMVYEFADCVYL